MPIITLTTDFGTRDGYVGAIKGVIARIAPDARVVDIAHDVPRGDIAHAAWVVATATREFPVETIHVVVVDPGVGGARREVIVETRGHWYVGPDNGVFAYVAADAHRAWLADASGFGHAVSPTFHGRDVFAPVAASLANGYRPSGLEVRLTGALPWGARPASNGRIVHVDQFGNLVSDLPAEDAGETVLIAGKAIPIVRTYEDVPPEHLLAYIGSAGTVEIAVRDGRADQLLSVRRGTLVVSVAAGAPSGPYR
jgi:hypothetical protein